MEVNSLLSAHLELLDSASHSLLFFIFQALKFLHEKGIPYG